MLPILKALNKVHKSMKRLNNLYRHICDKSNIELADDCARRGKHNWGIKKHDLHRESDNQKLLQSLIDLSYKTSDYDRFKIFEPKERIIFRLPYFPDRIAQWDIMLTMEPIWVKTFISQTYSCIKDRGIHKLAKDVKKALRTDKQGTKYCLKLDVKKFYPSIDHEILKVDILRRKIKDRELLTILDEIIDSAEGVPIGNYLSQFFANLFLSYFDHWLKEEVGVKHYFRYADDIVILSDSKEKLRDILILIKTYFHKKLNLEMKPNYQIFPVESRGIDFAGYIFFHTHTLLRKSIKQRMFRLINRYKAGKMDLNELKRRLTSYFGWLKYCDSKSLLQKIEKETGLHFSNWNGEETKISKFYGKDVRIIEVVKYSKYFKIHLIYKNKSFSVKSKSTRLYNTLKGCTFPLNFKLISYAGTKKNRIKCKT